MKKILLLGIVLLALLAGCVDDDPCGGDNACVLGKTLICESGTYSVEGESGRLEEIGIERNAAQCVVTTTLVNAIDSDRAMGLVDGMSMTCVYVFDETGMVDMAGDVSLPDCSGELFDAFMASLE